MCCTLLFQKKQHSEQQRFKDPHDASHPCLSKKQHSQQRGSRSPMMHRTLLLTPCLPYAPPPSPCFSTVPPPPHKPYLDSSDIQTTRPSMKLSHCHLGPYRVKCSVGRFAYRLTLSHSMRRLHPVFNVVKLTPAPPDPIVGRRRTPPPPPELIDGEEEYVVEEILDSRMFWRKLQYLNGKATE